MCPFLSSPVINSLVINIYADVLAVEPVLLYFYELKSTVDLEFTLHVAFSVGLYKCLIPCILLT